MGGVHRHVGVRREERPPAAGEGTTKLDRAGSRASFPPPEGEELRFIPSRVAAVRCVSATVDVGGYLNLPVIKPDGKYTNVKYYSEGTTKLDRARSHAGAMLKVKSYALFHHKK